MSKFIKKFENFMTESNDNETEKAELYINELIERHGNNPKKIRQIILNNLVNAPLALPFHASNSYIEEVWKAYNRFSPLKKNINYEKEIHQNL